MKTELIKLSKLKSNTGQIKGLPKNPRFIKDDKFEKLVKSIKEDPEMLQLREILVYDNSGELVIIAGNMRHKACIEAGLKETYCKILPNETPLEKLKAYVIKDNVSFGQHDFDLLSAEWDTDLLIDFGLDIPGFDLDTKLEAEEDDFDAPPIDEVKTDIVLGDYFEIGKHRLLCGDSTKIETFKKLFGEQLADLVVTDPPYNVAYEGKTKAKLKIENDKQSDSSFYTFLYDFYCALAAFTKQGGGVVRMAC